MLNSLRTFSQKSRIRALMLGMLCVGVLAICVFSALRITTGADAARPSPHVGERFSVFAATYGQSAKLGTDKGLKVGHITMPGVRFYADKAQTIIVNVQPIHGVVKNLSVTGPASWTDKQTVTYCEGFLPSGATAFRTVGPYTYYHTSAGDSVIFDAGHSTCEVAIAPNNE